MLLFAGLYIRTVRRWRSSGAPDIISAGIGGWSSRGSVGAGRWVVLWSASGMDFSPVRGVWVIVGGGGGFDANCRTRTGWIVRMSRGTRNIELIMDGRLPDDGETVNI
jgi:hypothetical protein